MLGGLLHCQPRARLTKPLVVRGGLGRTFGSLISFVGLTLLTWGAYILEDEIAHPVEAHPAALITAAFAIALSFLLFFYLLKPRRTASVGRRRSSAHTFGRRSPAQRLVSRKNARQDLAYQRIYVDHSRIRA